MKEFNHTKLPPLGDTLAWETKLPEGGTLRFNVSQNFFEEEYKNVNGKIFNEDNEECGEVRAYYFLKGEYHSWDNCNQETYDLWEAAQKSNRLEFLTSMLHTTNLLSRCLHADWLIVREENKGKNYGANTLLALFDYFHTKHGAKSMVGKLYPLQHKTPKPEKVKRPKKELKEDTKSLADYLAERLNLTFFGDDYWIHRPTPQQKLGYPWRPRGNN